MLYLLIEKQQNITLEKLKLMSSFKILLFQIVPFTGGLPIYLKLNLIK